MITYSPTQTFRSVLRAGNWCGARMRMAKRLLFVASSRSSSSFWTDPQGAVSSRSEPISPSIRTRAKANRLLARVSAWPETNWGRHAQRFPSAFDRSAVAPVAECGGTSPTCVCSRYQSLRGGERLPRRPTRSAVPSLQRPPEPLGTLRCGDSLWRSLSR
jgi:hypothetical protein